MKIQLLLEGTIKVPEKTYNGTMCLAASHVISMLVSYMENIADDDEDSIMFSNMQYLRKYKKQLEQKYSGRIDVKMIPDGYTTAGEVVIFGSEVDPRYLKRNPAFAKKKQTLDVYVMAAKPGDSPNGRYSMKVVGFAPGLEIFTLAPDDLEETARNPELLDAVFDRIEWVVEHELIHAIQQLALKSLSPDDAVDYYMDDDGNITDMDGYMMDENEYSPMIVTHAKEFSGAIKEMRARYGRLDPADIKAFFVRFVNPNAARKEGSNMTTPDFFEVLYRKDKAKWRKAVKLTYDKVREYL